jgi:hypothetical protein
MVKKLRDRNDKLHTGTVDRSVTSKPGPFGAKGWQVVETWKENGTTITERSEWSTAVPKE